MFRLSSSLSFVFLLVLGLVSFATGVTAQKEIAVKLYADSSCRIILSDNLTLPAFDLTGACFTLGSLSEISQCNTDSGGFLVLNFQFWSNVTNCPKNVPVDLAMVSRGKPGICSPINVTQGAVTHNFWGTFTCPTLSSDPSSLPMGEDIAFIKAIDSVSTLVENLSPSKTMPQTQSKLDRREKFLQNRQERIKRNGSRGT